MCGNKFKPGLSSTWMLFVFEFGGCPFRFAWLGWLKLLVWFALAVGFWIVLILVAVSVGLR